MVAQVSYPGVYIVEVPSGVRTITPVSTSIAAFFGRAREGPIFQPVRIKSLSDFERNFGAPHPESELADSVRLFFLNGGTDCYVVRIAPVNNNGEPDGTTASVKVKSEDKAQAVLEFGAQRIGSWGNELSFEVDYNTSGPEDTFNLRIYRISDDGSVKDSEEFLNCSMDPDSPRFAGQFISQQSKLVKCKLAFDSVAAYKTAAITSGYSESRKMFNDDQSGLNDLVAMIKDGQSKFYISIDYGPPHEVDLKAIAFPPNPSSADITGKIKDAINNNLAPTMKDSVDVQIVGGPTGKQVLKFISARGERKSINIQPAESDTLVKSLMLGSDYGGVERSRYGVFRPAPNGIFFELSRLNDLSNLTQNSFDKIIIDGSEINFDTKLITTSATDPWYLRKDASGTLNDDGNREKLRILASVINEKNVGWVASVTGSRLFLKRKSNNRNYTAQTIVTEGAPSFGNILSKNAQYYSLGIGQSEFMDNATMGGDSQNPPTVDSYKGSEASHSGFYALDKVDLFNLMIIPKDAALSEDDYVSLWAPASVYCRNRRAFLIVDPRDSWSNSPNVVSEDPEKGVDALRKTGIVKINAAVYYPRIKIRRNNGLLVDIGPGGAVAGIMARIDSSGGGGVWKAPAGLEADIQGGISGLEIVLTDGENGSLNKLGVNCLRSFPNGIVVWGARTLAGSDDLGSEWKYVPIRRLALMIEESLYRGTKWAVFEPNDEPLWAKIRLNVGAFMMSLFNQRAFQGSSPNTAFYVKCDSETTTEDDRNRGIVNIEVGFAPLKPAEFVVIKIQQMAGEL